MAVDETAPASTAMAMCLSMFSSLGPLIGRSLVTAGKLVGLSCNVNQMALQMPLIQ
jgi:hypothetical protein